MASSSSKSSKSIKQRLSVQLLSSIEVCFDKGKWMVLEIKDVHLGDLGFKIESDPKEAPSEAKELQPLGSRVPLMSEEFEASEPSGTRTVLSHSLVSLDSTTPLSPDHPLTHVSPILTPTQVSFYYRTARMAVRTQPTLSPGMLARIAKATALSLSSFHKIEGDELGKEDEEDESSDADDKRERVRAVSEPLGLGYEAARRRALESTEEISPSTYEVGQRSRSVPEQEGVERVSAFRQPTLVTWVDLKDDRVYIDIPAYAPLAAPVQTPPSPEWSSGSFLISPSSPIVPSPIASPVATLTATISVDEDKDVRELYTRSGAVRDEIFSQRYRFRSLKREQKRATVTFRALWRPVLALEAWAGRVDTWLADMSRDRYDDHRLIHDMLAQQDAMQRELQDIRGGVVALE
ncbi:hypothetical protein Tco_0047071 [Tanacetum coccineum]